MTIRGQKLSPTEQLRRRVDWLAAPDDTWTAEDGRPPTQWAAKQAHLLLEQTVGIAVCGVTEPVVTATARGGIEFTWANPDGWEATVVLPAEAHHPVEVSWFSPRADGAQVEDERNVTAVEEAMALVAGLTW